MFNFFRKCSEILFQGAGHLLGGFFEKIRLLSRKNIPVNSFALESEELQAPLKNSKKLLIASALTIFAVGTLVFFYKFYVQAENRESVSSANSDADSWIERHNKVLIKIRENGQPLDISLLSKDMQDDVLSKLLLERLVATEKFHAELKTTALPLGRLKIDWSQQDSAKVEALASSLREAIEQAIDSGQWKEAGSIANEMVESDLLSSGKLNVASEVVTRVSMGRASLVSGAVGAGFQEKNVKQLIDWVALAQADHPTDALLDAQTFLAELEIRAGHFSQARDRLGRLNKDVISESVSEPNPLFPVKSVLITRLADSLLQTGEFQQARKFLEPHTSVTAVEKNCLPLMGIYLISAEIAIEEAEYFKAENLFKRVQSCLDEHHRPGYFKSARMLNDLGIMYTQIGRQKDAAEALENASIIWTQALPPNHEWMGSLHNNLGALKRSLGQFEEARVEYDTSADIWRSALGESHPNMATYYNNIAELGILSKHMDEVKNSLNSALQLRRDAFGDEHPWTALVVSNMGEYLALAGQPGAALNNHRIALNIREKTLGKSHADTAMSLNNLGAVLYAGLEYRQSLECFTRAVAINKSVYGDLHPRTLLSKLNLAVNNMALGDYLAAEFWLAQILSAQEDDSHASSLQITARAKMGDVQMALNNFPGAEVQYEWVLESIPISDRGLFKVPATTAYKGLARIFSRQGGATASRALARKYSWAKP